jgi:hypothetical protein
LGTRGARSRATDLRRLQRVAADHRPKTAQVFAEPSYGRFELRDPAQEDRGADIGAHWPILGNQEQ